jgi:metal-responsive CopG/Arc/MetJ family transcriptional regulator
MAKDKKDNLNRFNFVLPDDLAAEIDKYRKEVGTLPPKAVAVRDLIKLGLEAHKAKESRED